MRRITDKSFYLSTIVVAMAVFMLTAPAAAVQESRQANRGSDYNLSLNDWVWIGYDWDNDGRIDYREHIFTYDLEEARKKSQMRAQREDRQMPGRQGRSRSERMPESSQRRTSQNRGRLDTVSGSIKTMRQVNLTGMDQPHVIARVQTREGQTARVDLGPVDNLRNIDLRKGDQVTIQGREGTINDQSVLTAHWLRTGGQELTVRRSHDRNLKKFTGEILKVKTASFKKNDAPDQVFARIRLDEGGTTAVNLGPKDELKDVNLNSLEGKEVTLLAHRGNIGNKTALIADEIRLDNRTIRIDRSKVSASAPGKSGSAAKENRQQ